VLSIGLNLHSCYRQWWQPPDSWKYLLKQTNLDILEDYMLINVTLPWHCWRLHVLYCCLTSLPWHHLLLSLRGGEVTQVRYAIYFLIPFPQDLLHVPNGFQLPHDDHRAMTAIPRVTCKICHTLLFFQQCQKAYDESDVLTHIHVVLNFYGTYI
jgi:hypothetical protein